MAQTGKRVILVDADLRKPSLHRVFQLPNIVGFTNLILDNSDATVIQSAVQPVAQVSNLTVVTSGPLPPNPSELLNSHQAVEIMMQLAQQADVVIYDTPPALLLLTL
jgi:capsular exopolysaccharide synthesis family protein